MKIEKSVYYPEPQDDCYDYCFRLLREEDDTDLDDDYLTSGSGRTMEEAKEKALERLRKVRAAIDEVLDKEEYQREKNERFAAMYGKPGPDVKTTDSDEWGIYDVCKVCGLSEFRCECEEPKLIPAKEDLPDPDLML